MLYKSLFIFPALATIFSVFAYQQTTKTSDAEEGNQISAEIASANQQQAGSNVKSADGSANVNNKAVNPLSIPDNTIYNGDVAGLAQGCYAIKSPNTGKYVSHMKSASAINDGLTYKFDKENAASFFFKPTALDGKFMLRDEDGRFFGTHLPLQISAGKTPGAFVEWEINKTSANTFSLKAVKLNRLLKHKKRNGHLVLNKWRFHEKTFSLVKKSDCKDFPEVSTNVEGDLNQLKGDPNSPVRGFADVHTHISSYQFMGGRFMAGQAFSRWGVEDALRDSKDKHGNKGSLDIIGNLYTFGNLDNRYDTRGWPDFPYWPNYKQMSHMGYYYKWIERVHQSGLRLMVTDLVENEVLCKLQGTINPAGWVGASSCNVMDSIRSQAKRLYEMQDYIDAQAGGKGKGFFRIVKSPAEARKVIADGKLAVVFGIEASETFNCGLKDKNCNPESVNKQLNEVYDLGVRSIFPVHKFDNSFGASPVENGFMNAGQWLSTGKFFETEECDAETQGQKMETGFPLVGKLPFFKEVLDAAKANPAYDEDKLHCSKNDLTPLGSYLVNRMIDKKMMIEFDHMSAKTAKTVLDIAENRANYSGLITSHSWMRKQKDGGLDHYNAKRLLEAGGFAGAYNLETYSMGKSLDDYLTVLEGTNFVKGVGVSTDMSGLGNQAAPRSDVDEKPLKYPFTTEFGTVVHKQKSGNREFDFNKDGMAHFGMLPDHIQDMRENLDGRIYEAIMNSTEAYLQMWERTESAPKTEHYNPL